MGQSVVGFDSAGLPVCAAPAGGAGGGTGADADGDGIPDAIDPCPNAPNFAYNGGSYCPASVYSINQGTVLSGATVWLANVHVTAASGEFITVTVESGDADYVGPDGASLPVRLSGLPIPSVGSRINVAGMVQYFIGVMYPQGITELIAANLVVITGP